MKFWEIEDQKLRWLILEGCFGNKGHVIGQSRGTFGEIYTFDHGERVSPRYGVAKIPRINPSETSQIINGKIVKFLHEINETYKYSHHGIIQRHADIKICMGVPVVYSRKRDRTLQDVVQQGSIGIIEAISIVIQLAHGLSYCSSKGLSSHQDMKPDNILADRVRDHFDMPDDHPLEYRVFICDFGMANASRVFGRPFGSRPYMAPEQYAEPATLPKSDVFALGVILHELLAGVHPIGEVTQDVWPAPLPEKGNKWKRENVWKAWARSTKAIDINFIPNPEVANAIEKCLRPDIASRHSMSSLEFELNGMLDKLNGSALSNLNLLLTTYDNYAKFGEESGWPYFESLLDDVNQFSLD